MKDPLIERQDLGINRLLEEIGQEGRKEKNARVPLNNIFYWWTRKPLSLSRASIILSTLNDVENAKSLLKLNLEKRSFFYPVDVTLFKKFSEREPQSIKILDPFAGSGNLIFEAARLGTECHACDYNPVSYLILKGVLEYPKKYSQKLAEDIKKYGLQAIENTKKELLEFFESKDEKISCFIWLWCVKCPHCGQKIPLTNNMWISRRQKLGFKIKTTENLDFNLELVENITEQDASKFTQKGGRAICIRCNNSLDYQKITESIKKEKQRTLAFLKTESGFRLATKDDIQRFQDAQHKLDEKWNELSSLIPQDEISSDPRSGIRNYGILFWHQYFSKRQQLVFATLIKNIKKICKEIQDKEYQKVIATYLSFLLGKHIDANSYGVHWHTGTEGPELTLSFRRTNFVFNHAEPNPFAQIRGNLYSILDEIAGSIQFCIQAGASAKIYLKSAFDLSEFSDFDIIIADPPNPNDVQFAEQSEFFYVWMKKILLEYYSELPDKIPIDEDVSDSPGRFGDRKIALSFYEKGLKKSISQFHSVLKDDGLVLFYFSPSHEKAWNILVDVLREAKLQATNLHSIHLENVTNIMPQLGVESLSTILVTCRKLTKEESVYFEDLPTLIEKEIKQKLDKISLQELLSFSVSDLLIISYGKILEILTKYSKVKSYQKDDIIQFDSLINQIQKVTLLYLFSRIGEKSITILGNHIAFFIFIKAFYDKILPDELYQLAKHFGLNKSYLESKKMIVEEDVFLRLAELDEFPMEQKASEVDQNNLYEQLCFVYQNLDKEKSESLNITRQENFRIDELHSVVRTIIQIKSIKNQFDKEMEKFNAILENIS